MLTGMCGVRRFCLLIAAVTVVGAVRADVKEPLPLQHRARLDLTCPMLGTTHDGKPFEGVSFSVICVEGAASNWWADTKTCTRFRQGLDASGLQVLDNRVTGTFTLRNNAQKLEETWEVTLDGAVKDGVVTGTYAAKAAIVWDKKPHSPTATGELKGRLRTAAQVLEKDALAKGANYSCWRGPNGSGTVISGRTLVEHGDQARLAWVSEDPIPPAGWDIGSITFSGGLNNPVVADGRVVLTYYEMSGDVVPDNVDEMWEKDGRQRSAFKTKEELRRRWLVGADDVVHCFDAATGRTLWKKIFKDQAVNYSHRGPGLKTGPHMTPCIADGKVYASGALMALYCLDLRTGELVWQHPVPERWMKIRDDAIKARTVPNLGHSLCNVHLQCVEGVLVVPQGGLTGYSAETGAKLWDTPEARGGEAIGPIRWPHGERTYIIQERRCVDPRDGKILWRAPGEHGGQCAAVASSNMVAFAKDGSIDGFSISLEGARKLWSNSVDGLTPVWGACRIAIMDGVAYAHVHAGRGKANYVIGLDVETGKELSRVQVKQRRDQAFDSLIGGDGYLMCGLDRPPHGLGYFKAGPQEVLELGKIDGVALQGWCSSAAYADGRLFFRRWKHMVCYDLRKP